MSRQDNGAAQQLQLPSTSLVPLSVWPTSTPYLLQKKKKGDMLSNVLETIISQPLQSYQDSPINFSLDLLEPSMFGTPPLLASGAGDACPSAQPSHSHALSEGGRIMLPSMVLWWPRGLPLRGLAEPQQV